jgi:di/tricarboxylate transporter
MSPAALSLAALVAIIGVSLTARLNVGILAIALAWLIAVFAAGWNASAVVAVFPSGLFLTLVGVTLLFGVAQKNGTLEIVARHAVRATGGNPALLPGCFFLLAGGVSTLGPGAIAATALIAPLAMSAGLTAGVPPFLMALVVANGANAGNLSPFSAVGVIVNTQMDRAGIGQHAWAVFSANFTAHALAGLGAYLLFGGLPLLRAARSGKPAISVPPFSARHWLTLAVLACWIVGVVGFKAQLGFSAFAAASFLILAGAEKDHATISAVPWTVIVMVCGVSTLVGVVEKTGGMDLFTTLLAQITTPGMANGMMAFVTGVISTYSSTSGVVYPAFLPAIPGLVEKLGGGDPLEIALSINVGAAMVDVSPLSTIGALCLAALPPGHNARALFRQLLLWGFAMTVVGAVFCQFAIHWFT